MVAGLREGRLRGGFDGPIAWVVAGCDVRILRAVESFPISAVQSRFLEMAESLHRHPDSVVVLTYREGKGEPVLLIHPDLWRARRRDVPAAELGDPLPFRRARETFSQLRRRAVFEGCHTLITSHGRDHAVVVPLDWARRAGLWEETTPGLSER